MSYELKLDPKRRASGRFIGAARKALINAAMDEKARSGVSQQKIAERLGINKSTISRLLRGEANLTLRTIAEIAWALGYTPRISLERTEIPRGSNHSVDQHFKSYVPIAKPETTQSGSNFEISASSAAKPTGNATNSRTLETSL